MPNCVICHKSFPARRGDAECCSANCRNKKKRMRDGQMKLSKAFSWDLYQHQDMQYIRTISPEAAQHIEQIRLLGGAKLGDHAIQALLLGLDAIRKDLLA